MKNNIWANKVPAKVFRYFPLKPRPQRLFVCPNIFKEMQWHAKERPKDGILRHPTDGKAWKDFDLCYLDFENDARNVRLGLAIDGFNPFRTMNLSHSTWPVVIMIYNLSSWNCTKPEYRLLSSIIPGPKEPGQDIDIYLHPLIEELKELWKVEIETFDAATLQLIRHFNAVLIYYGWWVTTQHMPIYVDGQQKKICMLGLSLWDMLLVLET